jgi:secernin
MLQLDCNKQLKMPSCDSFVILPDKTYDSTCVLIGKNSDREPGEAQNVTFVAAMNHNRGSRLKCTRKTIDQVAHTNACVLFQPHWMWGAEMGVNEHGVVIANEALFVNSAFTSTKKDAHLLLGMDLLRLALERASTGKEALDVMLGLLKEHEQGGNCHAEDDNRLCYSSAFMIADKSGHAYHLETANQEFAWRRIESGIATISNYCMLSGDLCQHSSMGTGAAFEWHVSDRLVTWVVGARARQCRLLHLLSRSKRVDVAQCFNAMRDHDLVTGAML